MIKKLLPYLLLIGSQASFSYDSNLEEYTKKLNKIDRIEKDLSILQKQFYRGSNKNTSIIDNSTSNFNSDIEVRIGNIEEQLRSFTGEIERLEHLVQTQENKFKKFSEDIEYRLNEQSTNSSKDSKEEEDPEKLKENSNLEVKLKGEEDLPILGTVKSADTQKTKNEIQKKKDNGQLDFEQAFALIKANKFSEAEINFKKIIEENKNDEISARSLFWLGEIYIAKKNHEQAAIYFLQSYKKLPKYSKAPESLIRLVSTLKHLKKNKEACAIISKLEKEFKNLTEKQENKIQEESDSLKCE